jgi:hypothetical protein
MLAAGQPKSKDENFEVELGPLFTAGVLALVYGLDAGGSRSELGSERSGLTNAQSSGVASRGASGRQ